MKASNYVQNIFSSFVLRKKNMMPRCHSHLCGDQLDEGEDGSGVSSRRSQLQALVQEAMSGGMGPKMQPAPDEHQVPAGGSG